MNLFRKHTHNWQPTGFDITPNGYHWSVELTCVLCNKTEEFNEFFCFEEERRVVEAFKWYLDERKKEAKERGWTQEKHCDWFKICGIVK